MLRVKKNALYTKYIFLIKIVNLKKIILPSSVDSSFDIFYTSPS